MRSTLGFFALAAALIIAAWAYLGSPIAMPQAPLAPGDKLHCISYSPFRDNQSPLSGPITIEAWQIEKDFARLAQLTRCVRTYSTEFGLDRVADVAKRHGLKVIQGLWLSSDPVKNKNQIESTIALANKFPETIEAIVVGNEVLLRGEISGDDLAGIIRAVKARVSVKVTYADVWEFWLRFPQLFGAVDFITIHILPYWEDFPIPADRAGAHVEAIRKKVADAYPGKEILIGEVGWPSAGRMREGALPSPDNQARVVQDVLAFAKRDNIAVNVIEAFDQPWKRKLEGTVGGHWGIFDNDTREPKFIWGEAVSNHPHWRAQAIFGVLLAAAVFAAQFFARGNRKADWKELCAIALIAAACGVTSGWAIENMMFESLGIGGWIRSCALVLTAVAAPVLGAAMIASGQPIPVLATILNPRAWPSSRLVLVYGATLIVVLSLALQVTLVLVFDPRYRDFPFAPLTAAILPFAVHGLVCTGAGMRGAAELATAAILALSVVYIVPNETLANWQSLWTCAAAVAFAITLARVRGAPN
jgi:glucan 1,3-beta-glucosidase